MGATPGTSARCAQCRQKKRKCGLEQPECLRCIKAGIQCSGPLDTSVYVNLDAKVMHEVSHRKALHKAYATRAYQTPSIYVLAQQSQDLETLSEPSDGPQFSSADQLLSTASARTFYESIVDEFTPRLKVGVFSGDRLHRRQPIYSSVATCIKALLPHVSRHNELLDLGFFSLLTKYVGALRNDEDLGELAISSYTSALGQFHQQLHCMEQLLHSQPHNGYAAWVLLSLCLSLLLFELVDQSDTFASTYETHLEGALMILQATGPEIYQQSTYLQVCFAGLRGLIIPTLLRRRQRTFLADYEWLDLPFCIIGRTTATKLHDLALRLPGLTEQVDVLKSLQKLTFATASDHNLLVDLASDFLQLRRELFEWLKQLTIAEQEPMYWLTGDLPYMSSGDTMCVPEFSHDTHKISFRDGARAGILAHYWAYHLELAMGLLGLCEIFPDDDNGPHLNTVTGLDMAFCLHEAESLAEMIAETVPYMISCLEGRLSVQGPLETLTRYRQRMSSTHG